jgi:hypothetical protein
MMLMGIEVMEAHLVVEEVHSVRRTKAFPSHLLRLA